MKLVIIKTNLKDGLSAAEKTSDNSTLAILKNALIEAQNNKIKLVTTNLEQATTYFVPGKIIEEGQTTVPVGLFSNLIANIPSERLNLETKENNLEIKTDNYEALVQGQSAKDFPLIPEIKNNAEYLEISAAVFKEALEEVLAASQFSDIRPELNSILFNFSLDSLKLAATDSFRLAEKTINANQFKTNHQEGFRLLAPLKTCQDVLRVLKDDEELKIFHDENQILFKTEKLEFISRLAEGNFPDYDYLLPKKFSLEAAINRQEFTNALKLSGVFGSRTNEIKLKFSESKKSMEIFSTEQGIGENKYVLPAKIKGEPEEASFNWKYILDGLKSIKSEEVFFGLNEENKPALLKGAGDGSYFYILMPIMNK